MEKDKGKINDYRGLENLIKIVVQECDCPFSETLTDQNLPTSLK